MEGEGEDGVQALLIPTDDITAWFHFLFVLFQSKAVPAGGPGPGQFP